MAEKTPSYFKKSLSNECQKQICFCHNIFGEQVPSVYDIQNTKIVINSRLINRVDLDPLSDNIILHMHTFIHNDGCHASIAHVSYRVSHIETYSEG